MHKCLRPGCRHPALADWWRMCLDCSLPLIESMNFSSQEQTDRAAAAGFDAIDWAARIAPAAWGAAAENDGWTATIRCLTVAAALTGRAVGCPHTVAGAGPVPVVAVAGVSEVLQCPPCAEQIVAGASRRSACDRCGHIGSLARLAALTGNSLIVVGQICAPCRRAVLGSDVVTI